MIDHLARSCPVHDCLLDRETGMCDHCARDARLDCAWCGGVGQLAFIDAAGQEWPQPCRHCQTTGTENWRFKE